MTPRKWPAKPMAEYGAFQLSARGFGPLARLNDRTHLIDANETTETFRRNAAQTFVHVLSSRDPQTPSVEQNLDSELSWEGRGSAGPDTTNITQPRSPREQSN
jgi:hypothetical protein